MRKLRAVLAALLVFVMVFAMAACGAKKNENSLVGTWEYTDAEDAIGAVYVLKDDGTGTYTIKAGEQEVSMSIKYEAKDGHLLVTFVDSEIYGDDVFDNEFSFKDANTLIVKDSFGDEMTFVKK